MVKPISLSAKPKKRAKATKGAKAAQTEAAPGDTEKKILAAARREFISKGLEGARMQAVATQAGVNKALLHYYFRSKERLYQKVLEDTLGIVWGRLAQEFRHQPPNPQQGLEPLLRTVVTIYVHTLAANPDFPLFMFREMASGGAAFREGIPDIIRRFQDIPTAMAAVLAAEAKAGKIKPIKPIHFFMNLMGMTVATFLLMPMIQKLGSAFGVKSDFGDAFLEERIHSVTDTLLNGIRIKR